MAYGNNPSGSNKDAVRLLVGDISTSTAAELLADDDYTFFLNQTPTLYDAAALAAQSLANVAAQGGIVRKEVGDLVLVWDYDQYIALSRRFTVMSSLQATPFAGGISKDQKLDQQNDADRVKPYVFRGLMDNPAAVAPSGTTST